jgi:hypothetical protein
MKLLLIQLTFTTSEFWRITSKSADVITIIGIVTIVSLVSQLYRDFKSKKKLEKSLGLIKEIQSKDFLERKNLSFGITTPFPIAVCMSLLPNDKTLSIKNDVSAYLKTQNWKMPIIEIQSDGINIDNLNSFINDLNKSRNEIQIKNKTEIHLFIQGPVMAGVIVGSVFSSWKLIKLYSPNIHSRQYEYWGLLEK